MSYILDALKKAEQRRHRAARVPTLATVHRVPAVAGRRIWPWIAAPMILLTAGVLAWLLRPTQTGTMPAATSTASRAVTPAPAPAPTAPVPARPVEPAVPVVPPAGPEAAVALPPRGLPSTHEPVPPARTAVERTPAASRPDGAKPGAAGSTPPAMKAPPAQPRPAPVDAPTPAPPAAPVAPRPAVAAPPSAVGPAPPQGPAPPPARGPSAAASRPQERAATSLAAPQGTPSAVQEQVQKMKLQMVVYSEVPAQRFVFIDNQKYIEGSSIDGKLVVETITSDGAVLNYEGQRFQLRQ